MLEVYWGIYQALQGFKLIYSLLGVAHADLAERLVLVPPGLYVFTVQDVVLGLLGVVSGLGQLRAQRLKTIQQTVSHNANKRKQKLNVLICSSDFLFIISKVIDMETNAVDTQKRRKREISCDS